MVWEWVYGPLPNAFLSTAAAARAWRRRAVVCAPDRGAAHPVSNDARRAPVPRGNPSNPNARTFEMNRLLSWLISATGAVDRWRNFLDSLGSNRACPK
jgi:hypothetical protein